MAGACISGGAWQGGMCGGDMHERGHVRQERLQLPLETAAFYLNAFLLKGA